jgi:hypothetical protein
MTNDDAPRMSEANQRSAPSPEKRPAPGPPPETRPAVPPETPGPPPGKRATTAGLLQLADLLGVNERQEGQ